MASGKLTTTSYAVLGLLAIQPWSTYELTRQLERSVGRFWPRAASKLYEEPRKLMALGLARGRAEQVGRRPRTVYSITPKGRRALRRWLAEPGAGPVLEFEQLLQIFLAEHGSRADTLATLAAARAWATERNAENLRAARAYAAGHGRFPRRAAQAALVGGFLTDFYALVAQWAERSETMVQSWPDDPAEAEPDGAELAAIARRASWSER